MAKSSRKKATSKKKSSPAKAKLSVKSNLLAPLAGLCVMLLVLGLLNAQWLGAQIEYRMHSAKVAAAEPINGSAIDPKTAPTIYVSKIGLKAPVVFDEPSYNESKIQLALRRGTLHYGTTAVPGQKGNIVIIGHSSGQLWAPGNYKFVFTLLDKVQVGDKIIIDYKGTRYIYQVRQTKVVQPNDFTVLTQTDTPTLSLVTCTPVGTSKYRLVVQADQISPKPDSAAQNNTQPASVDASNLPKSASRSLWQTITSL